MSMSTQCSIRLVVKCILPSTHLSARICHTALPLNAQAKQAAEASLQQATSSLHQHQHTLQQQHAQQAQHTQQLAAQVVQLQVHCTSLTQQKTDAENLAASAARQEDSAGKACNLSDTCLHCHDMQ